MSPEKRKVLSQVPLSEAIFEMRWKTSGSGSAPKRDSGFLAGILYEKIGGDYKFQEDLDIAQAGIPDEMTEGVPKYRFRVSENDWPLVQLGAGVLTVNETTKYEWPDFKKRVLSVTEKLMSFHPVGNSVSGLSLRYLNTFPFDGKKDDVASFLNNFGIKIDVPAEALKEVGINSTPRTANFKLQYKSANPEGVANMTFAKGKNKDKKEVFVWEIGFKTSGADIPSIPEDLEKWLEGSHEKNMTLFFTIGENVLK